MRILVDTNVFLDVLMAREPWVRDSRYVLDWADAHPSQAWIAWHSLSNLYYIGMKTVGIATVCHQIDAILETFEVAAGNRESVLRARRLKMPDFEDALQATAAQTCGLDLIVTRNGDDFVHSPVQPITPALFRQQQQRRQAPNVG
ncbi:MAG: PIN domain-containing protein [Puniceicoccaceae bacterium]|nr:MAG: PIN domain-containing protein [Puniceicoccaceae bacterium]